jgi:hypothetical protein
MAWLDGRDRTCCELDCCGVVNLGTKICTGRPRFGIATSHSLWRKSLGNCEKGDVLSH